MKIYDENLYLYQILKQAENIRKEMECTFNSLNDEEAKEYKKRMQQIYRIKNNAFSLLIRNGFLCSKENGNLVMDINEDKFVCREDAIKTIFQKEYDSLHFIVKPEEREILDEVRNDDEKRENEDIAIREIPQESIKNAEIEVVEEHKPVGRLESCKMPDSVGKSAIVEERTTIQSEQPKSVEVKDAYETEDTMEVREQKNNREIFLQYPSDTEKEKTRQELILDMYTLKMRQPKVDDIQGGSRFKKRKVENKLEEKTEFVEIKVVPLTIPENGNELSSDILVYIKSATGDGVFASSKDGRKSVNVDTDKYSFVVRGEWKNGKFYSRVFTAGDTLAGKYEIERKVKEIRPEKGGHIGLGHPLLYIKEIYEEDGEETESILKIHAIPLSGKNSADGHCTSTFYLERQDGSATSYITGDSGYVVYKFEEEVYKLSAKWDRDVYCVTNEHLI